MMFNLLRCWGFSVALLSAVAVGLVGAYFWGEQPMLPLLRLPIPMYLLLPGVTSTVLTWTLHERWPEQLSTSVRHPGLVPSARFLGTQLCCALAAVIASTAASRPAVEQCSIGASLAAVLTVMLGRRAALALIVCSFVWLAFAAQHRVAVATQDTSWLACALLVGCGAAYVWCEARRATPR
jgi:hypothetical protein